MESEKHWVGTWATAPAPSLTGESLSDLTLRMNARVSIGGDTLRVRVSNAYGEGPGAVAISDAVPPRSLGRCLEP